MYQKASPFAEDSMVRRIRYKPEKGEPPLQNSEKTQKKRRNHPKSPFFIFLQSHLFLTSLCQVFACGEDSHALRLESELSDLRAANANRRICFANARQIYAPLPRQRAPIRGPFAL